MSGSGNTVTVASKLPMAVQIRSEARARNNESEVVVVLVGERDPGAVNGFGLTYDVDAATINEWLAANPDMAEFVTITDDAQIEEHADPANTYGYEVGLEAAEPPDPAPTAPPVNRDVPYASQQGGVLNCTMGNWDNVPDSYAYQWEIDGADVGGDSANYTVTPADVGKSAVCIVTATNALGSTEAPPSNAVMVA